MEVLSPDHRLFISEVAQELQVDARRSYDLFTRRAFGGTVVVLDHGSGKARLEPAGYGLKMLRDASSVGKQRVIVFENIAAQETVFAAVPPPGKPVGGFSQRVATKLLANPVFVYLQRNIAKVEESEDKVYTLLYELRFVRERLQGSIADLATCLQILESRKGLIALAYA